MITKDIIVTFDLKGTSTLYDDFYLEAEKIGLIKFIPAQRITSNVDTELPNTTLYGRISGVDSQNIANDMCDKIKNIYIKLNLKGTFLITTADTWYINHR